ncbi:MAG: TolC family outer membrane protein [Magnetococcales bacterium]|nr:TolC family outer membrane protein [Magnetococcales bacterium]
MNTRFKKWHGWTLLGLAATMALAQPGAALNLPEAVSRAMTTNPEVRSAMENRRAVEQSVETARAGYLPTVDLSTSLGHEYSDNPVNRSLSEPGASLNRGESGIKLNQMLFDGQATRSGVAASASRAAAAGFGYDLVAEGVAIAAADAYLEVMKQRELLQLSSDNVALHKKILGQVRSRHSSGTGSEADIQQTESRLALADANTSALEGSLENALTRYYRIIGEAPARLVQPMPSTDKLPRTLEESLKDAMAHHPAILAATQDLEAAMAQQEAAKSGYWPKVNLEMSANANDNTGGVSGYAKAMAALLRLDYNIFRGGSDNSRKEEAIRRSGQAREQLELARRQVDAGVRDAWKGYLVSQNRVSHLERHQAISKKVTSAYHDQFQRGQRPLLDVLNAENELMSARAALRTEQYALLVNSYRLMAAMGRLRDYLDISPPQTTVASNAPLQPSPAAHVPSSVTPAGVDVLASDAAMPARAGGELPRQSPSHVKEPTNGARVLPSVASAMHPLPDRSVTNMHGGYAVLLGAFASRENVDKLRYRLEQAGFAHFEKRSVVNGRLFFRVFCGPFASMAEAHSAAGRLLKTLGMEVKVVKEKENREREDEEVQSDQPQDQEQTLPVKPVQPKEKRAKPDAKRIKPDTKAPEEVRAAPEQTQKAVPILEQPPVEAVPLDKVITPPVEGSGASVAGETQKPAPEQEQPKVGAKSKKETNKALKKGSATPVEVDLPEIVKGSTGGGAKGQERQPKAPPPEAPREKSEEWFSSPANPVELPSDLGKHLFSAPESRTPAAGDSFWPDGKEATPSWRDAPKGDEPTEGSWRDIPKGDEFRNQDLRRGVPGNDGKSGSGNKPMRSDEEGGIDMAPGPDFVPSPSRGGEERLLGGGQGKADEKGAIRNLDQDLKKWFLPNKDKNKGSKPTQPGTSLQPGMSSPPSEASPKPGASLEGSYSVFLGSFSVPKLAELVSDRTRQSGVPVYQQRTTTGGRSATQVYAGPFPQEETARAVLLKMQKEQDLTDGFVVRAGAQGVDPARHKKRPSAQDLSSVRGDV